MSRQFTQSPPEIADYNSRNASFTLALTIPGDTLLYLLLPLHHAVFGVSLTEAGLLLAANRLVRIAGYGWVARFYARRGPRSACLFAAVGSVLATFGYALLSGVWSLVIVRLIWGLSFAAMNIATQALATAEPAGASRRSGRMRAVIAAGSVGGLLGGAAVSQVAGPHAPFLVLAFVALIAIKFAVQLPDEGEGAVGRLSRPRFGLPSRLDAWSFIQGMTLDGLFVIGMSVLAAAAVPEYAALAAGAALALRYIAEILLGPVGGALAERYGARHVLMMLSAASAAGLAVIGAGLLWSGAVLVVMLRGLIQPLPAPVVAMENPGRDRVPALARLATWRDLGAGAGPLLAGAAADPPALAVVWRRGFPARDFGGWGRHPQGLADGSLRGPISRCARRSAQGAFNGLEEYPGRLQWLEEYIVLDLADDDLIDDRGVDVIRGRLGNLTHAGPSKENRT